MKHSPTCNVLGVRNGCDASCGLRLWGRSVTQKIANLSGYTWPEMFSCASVHCQSNMGWTTVTSKSYTRTTMPNNRRRFLSIVLLAFSFAMLPHLTPNL